jgi:primosomal protein N'
MKINQITYQHRRDFTAFYECEGCGHTVERSGYDDANFHQNVIPKMRCEKCGKTGAECGADYRPLTTKYPEGYQV